jgi:gas vesicle protein
LVTTLTTASITTAGIGTFTLLKIMTATKIKLGISALVVAGAATALVVQHQAQTELRDQSESLRQQIAQLQTNNESLSNRLAAAADAKPSSAQSLPDGQSNELLKLRGEVGVLQRQASEASQEAQVAEQKLATALSAKAQFASHQSAIINAAKQVGLAMRVFSGDHENQFPTNFLQLTNELGNSFSIRGIELFSFEFVNAGAVSLDHPNMVELRERLARQAPDGTWQRIYGFADGSVQTATSYDGNFDAWEKANTYSPPPNQ